MFWFLYNLLFLPVYLLLLPHFVWRMLRRGGYSAHFGHRLAIYSKEKVARLRARPRIWIHAVSVGEVGIALRFIEHWQAKSPDDAFLLSVTTSTADAIARRKISPPNEVIYFPLDSPFVMRRVFRQMELKGLILVESEFWPNLLRGMKKRGLPVCLINGRISDRSFPRYQKVQFLTRRVFRMVDLFCVQSEQDKNRILALGAAEDRIRVIRSLKYETAERNAEKEVLARAALDSVGFANKPVILGGSTWPGEEAVLIRILEVLRNKGVDVGLVLVPRHFERAQDILPILAEAKLSVSRRSVGDSGPADVLLADTTGELMGFFAVADFVFIGKSLCEKGGQNPIEPALLGKPVVVGPNMRNFPGVMRDFLDADAIKQVVDEAGLLIVLQGWLENPAEAEALGARAASLVQEHAHTLDATVEQVARQLS